jgi:hypothetical protein
VFRKTRNYSSRTSQAFVRSRERINDDLNAIFARHAKEGLLQSGTTIKRGCSAFEDRTREALRAVHGEFSANIKSRGREWDRAMTAIGEALDTQISDAAEILSKAIKVAAGTVGPGSAPTEGPAVKATYALIASAASRLREEHNAFRDGWTSEPGKEWHQRHPIAYAIALLVLGAIAGNVIPIIAKAFGWSE